MVNINWKIAPKDWKSFEGWHAAACSNDNLSAMERFKKEGGKMPVKDVDKRTKKKVK